METSRVATLEPGIPFPRWWPISCLFGSCRSRASCVAQCASVPSGRLAHTFRMKPTNAAHRVGGRLQVLLSAEVQQRRRLCAVLCSSFQQAAWLRDGVCCSSVPKHHRSRRRMGQNTNDGRVLCAWEGHDMAGKARTSERGRLSARVSSRSLPHSIAGGLRWHGAVTFRACCARSPRPRHENWRGGHPAACRATGRAHVRYAAGPLARACCSGQRRARGDGLRLRAIKALYFAPRRRDA